MAEIDTSSYPKPTPGLSALDTVGKLQGLEQQHINIDRSKLDLMNKGYEYLIRAVNSLDPKTATQEDFYRVGQSAVDQGILKPEQFSQFVKTIPTDKAAIPKFQQEFLRQAQTTQEMINWDYGQRIAPAQTGQTSQEQVFSQKPGFAGTPDRGGALPTNAPIQQQVPPTAQAVGSQGQPAFVGPQSPQNAPGTTSGPAPLVQPLNRLPVAPQQQAPQRQQQRGGLPEAAPMAMSNGRPQLATDGGIMPVQQPTFNKNFQGGDPLTGIKTPAQVVQQNNFGPRGLPTGMPPLFEEGRKQYVEDQNLATQRLTAIKPAIQAIPLIKGLTTGIGTENYNKALAGLSNLGLVTQGVTNKVAIRQELEKKLAQYVSSNPVGQRSDAAQTLAEAGSPSPRAQINPALIKLTKDSIVLDRIQAARAAAFEGGDFTKYGQHRSTFPAKMDERAFGFDLMEPNERKELLTSMNKKLNSSKASERKEAEKFKQSLSTVDKLGYLDLSLE